MGLVVAVRAGLVRNLRIELALVGTLVAVHTKAFGLMWKLEDLLFPKNMASRTGDSRVAPLQLKSGGVVVEFFSVLLEHLPALRAVALIAALRLKRRFSVGSLVTASTIVFLKDRPKVLPVRATLNTTFLGAGQVAVRAIEPNMLSVDGKTGVDAMIKRVRLLPGMFRVAIKTFLKITQLFGLMVAEAVKVLVAGEAIGLEPFPGEMLHLLFFVFLFVTLSAFQIRVLPTERIPGRRVVEGLDLPSCLRVALLAFPSLKLGT